MRSQRFAPSPGQFASIFPFHLAFDRDMAIVQLGDVLERICPELSVGTQVGGHFRVKRPNAQLEFDSIRRSHRSMFLLESVHTALTLKGQMLYVERRDMMLFLCSPWVSDIATLESLGLSLSDFATHDPVADFLFLLQAQSTALSDHKALAGKLARNRAELRLANDRLMKDQLEINELNRSLEKKVGERTDDLRHANEMLRQEEEALRKANKELRERNRELLDVRAQATTDSLTGLSNHRSFHEAIRGAVQKAQDTGVSVGLVMMDIDGFKRVNDSCGHQAGDQVLRDLADALRAVVRETDAYRYGGDEFTVLLPGADARETVQVAERLRREVANATEGNGVGVTVSLGVTSFRDVAGSAEALIFEADAAMYWAKSLGKNRIGEWRELIKERSDGTVLWYVGDRAVQAPDAVSALMAALAAKDPSTAAHTERCSLYAAKLANELSLGEQETSVVRLASLLHDIGKLAVPDEILGKPGPLNEDEWDQMKRHPGAAREILGKVHGVSDATPSILHHHEHFDGSGYPDGLAGEEIPMGSRILLVTDAFDAMTNDRPYRKALPVEAAIAELMRNSGSQFDPVIVDAFLRTLSRERYLAPPAGDNGRAARPRVSA